VKETPLPCRHVIAYTDDDDDYNDDDDDDDDDADML